MLKPRSVAFAIALAVLGTLPHSAEAATVQRYAEYTQMDHNAAGAFYDKDGNRSGSWNWKAGEGAWRGVSWDNPAYREWFREQGDYVVLDGWSDNGTYYTQRVTAEQIGDANCKNMRQLPITDGRQRYAKRTVTDAGYCLLAAGTITEKSSGKTFSFRHRQQYSAPFNCSTRFYRDQTCISQHERWADNNNSEFAVKRDQIQYLARGKGNAFWIKNVQTGWTASGTYQR